MADIIEARVIQKIATASEWATSELLPYKGEVMLVSDSSGKVLNIKIGDGIRMFPELDYMFDSITQNVNYIPYEATPTSAMGFTLVGEGAYANGIVVDANMWAVLYWDGAVWTEIGSYDLPTVDIANDYGTSSTKAISQAKATETKELLDTVINDPVLGIVSIINNEEFLYAIVDEESNLLWGKRYDGTTYDCDDALPNSIQGIINDLSNTNSSISNLSDTVDDNQELADSRYGKLYFNKGYFLNNLSNAFSEDILKRYSNSLAIKDDLQTPLFQTTLNTASYPEEFRHHDCQWDVDSSGNVYMVFNAIGSHVSDDSSQALNHVRLAIFNISNLSIVTYIDLAQNGDIVDGRPIQQGTGQANLKVQGNNVHIWMSCTLDSPVANKQTLIKTTYSITSGTVGDYSVCKFKNGSSLFEINYINLVAQFPDCSTGSTNSNGQTSASTTFNLHSDGMYYGTITRHFTIYPIIVKTSDFIEFEVVKITNELPIDPLFESATVLLGSSLYIAVRQMYRSDVVSGITLPTNNHYYLDGVVAKLDLTTLNWVDFVRIPQQGSKMSFAKDQFDTLYLLSNAYSTARNNAYILRLDNTSLNRSVLAVDAKLSSTWDSPISKMINGNNYCSYTFGNRIGFTQFNFGYGIDTNSIFKTLFGI